MKTLRKRIMVTSTWGRRTLGNRQRSQWWWSLICITPDYTFWLCVKWLGTLSKQNGIICEAVCLPDSLEYIEMKIVACPCDNPERSEITFKIGSEDKENLAVKTSLSFPATTIGNNYQKLYNHWSLFQEWKEDD